MAHEKRGNGFSTFCSRSIFSMTVWIHPIIFFNLRKLQGSFFRMVPLSTSKSYPVLKRRFLKGRDRYLIKFFLIKMNRFHNILDPQKNSIQKIVWSKSIMRLSYILRKKMKNDSKYKEILLGRTVKGRYMKIPAIIFYLLKNSEKNEGRLRNQKVRDPHVNWSALYADLRLLLRPSFFLRTKPFIKAKILPTKFLISTSLPTKIKGRPKQPT